MSKLVSLVTGQTYAVCVQDVPDIPSPEGWIKDKCYKCGATVAVDPNDLADPDTLHAKRMCVECVLKIARKEEGDETVEDF